MLGLLLLFAPAYAQNLQTTLANKQTPKYWSLLTSISRSNSLYVQGDGNDQASVDMAIAPSWPLNRDYSMSALVEYSQDLKLEDNDFGRGSISFSKSSGLYGIAKRLKLTPRVSFGFPLSETAKATSLQFSVRPGTRIEVNRDYLITKRLGLALDLSVGRNFHQYDTAISGKVNTEWSASEILEASWSFNDMFAFSVNVAHYDMRTYGGYQSDALSHGEELSMQMNKNWAVAVGHNWGAPYVSTKRANGQDLNFEVADSTNSMVYAQLTFIL